MEEFEAADPIPLTYTYSGIFVCMLLFRLIHWSVCRYFVLPKSCQKENEAWQWRNECVSWIHAFIVAIWVILSFYRHPEMMSDLVNPLPILPFVMIVFSGGYFVHDSIDIVINGKVATLWEVSFHHFGILSCLLYNVTNSTCIGLNCLCLLAEINSVFLHGRKLLQMARFEFSHWLYRLNAMINLVTHVVFRCAVGLSIDWFLWAYYNRISAAYYYFICVFSTIINVTQAMMLNRFVKNDVLRPLKAMRANANGVKVEVNNHENNHVNNHNSIKKDY